MRRETVVLLLDTLRFRSGLSADDLRDGWRTVDAKPLLWLVRYEGADVWLYRRFRQQHIEASEPFATALRQSAHASNMDNMRIDAQTNSVISRLTAASIPWALLKGQARRAGAIKYPYADARAVSDVDLLVPETRADEAWELLCAHGFRRLVTEPVLWRADHHRPTLIDEANVGVELHTTTCLTVSPDEAWRRATERADAVEWSGLDTTIPNATELVWQALSHGVADGTRSYSLRALLSIAAVLAEDPFIDWATVEARIVAEEIVDNDSLQPVGRERTLHTLATAAWLAGVALPPLLTAQRKVDLVPLLLWRARVLNAPLGRAVRERLLEEALRVEAMMPLTPGALGSKPLFVARRRLTSAVARAAYVAWRVFQ